MDIIVQTGKVSLLLQDFPDYGVINNKIYNLKTGNEAKRTMKKYTEGYWLNRRFVSAKSIKFARPDWYGVPF